MAERKESTFSLRYAVSATIAAPAATVWATLTDAEGFAAWNSTVDQLQGPIARGQKLSIRVPVAPGREFTPTVVVLEPENHMVWQDGFYPMFQGTRTFRLHATVDGTRFEMVEEFRGLMLPFIKRSLPDFAPIFDRFAADLKASCEA